MSPISRYIDKRLAAYQNTIAASYFSEVNNMYNQICSWKHDYKNHISVMKNYLLSGEHNVLLNYMNKLNDDLTSIDTIVKTGNRMMDAILNSKISLALSNKVPVIAEAQIFTALTTPDTDLCIIIGNLLDNAIEASLTLPENERMIRIFMEMKGSRLYISVTNLSAAKKQKKKNGRFTSLKGKNHGFGLVNIDRIVERHCGYINRNSEDGAFTTEILLPQ